MISSSAFRYKSPDRQKLLSFGFTEKDGFYSYETGILENQFLLTVNVTAEGGVETELIDKATGEPYTLHLTEACGSFVGGVRSACNDVLSSVAEKCFDSEVFKSADARDIIAYVRKKYGDELEFLWPKFSDNAVLRRKDNGKWYAVLIVVPKIKLGIESDEKIEIIDLRTDSKSIASVICRAGYYPGYHMNKKSWVTIALDGSVPIKEIFVRIDRSYELVGKTK